MKKFRIDKQARHKELAHRRARYNSRFGYVCLALIFIVIFIYRNSSDIPQEDMYSENGSHAENSYDFESDIDIEVI